MADVPEHGRIATAPAADAHGHSHHPISVYLKVWGYLFVLSAMSYMVDYFLVQGVLRWSLIPIFMMRQPGMIVDVFMHTVWVRLARIVVVLVHTVRIGEARGRETV